MTDAIPLLTAQHRPGGPDASLRLKSLGELVGPEAACANLRAFVDAAFDIDDSQQRVRPNPDILPIFRRTGP